jgi:hypothetical protein
MALVGLLRREGPQTATQAAEKLGDTVPNCSFHLRQLAKYGLAERVEGSDGREKPWRATALFTTWPSASEDPDMVEAVNALTGAIMEQYFARAREWLARSGDDPAQWRDLTGTSDYLLWVTPEELRGVQEQIDTILSAFAGRLGAVDTRPEGARAISVFQLSMTTDEPGR